MTRSNLQPHDFTLKELSEYFHLSINDASIELNVCATVLKKICRRNNVTRWPYRKISSIDSLISTLEKTIGDGKGNETVEQELATLRTKREYLLQNPNSDYNTIVPKYYINTFAAKFQNGPTKTIKKSKSQSPVKSSKFMLKEKISMPNIQFPLLPVQSIEANPMALDYPARVFTQSEDQAAKVLVELKSWESRFEEMLQYKRISFGSETAPTCELPPLVQLTHDLRASSEHLACCA